MTFNDHLYEYNLTQGQVMSDYMSEAQKVLDTYQEALNRLAVESSSKAQDAYGRYTSELQAASTGDDGIARAATAWSTFQQTNAQLYQEYITACQASYQAMMGSLQDLQMTREGQVLDSYIGLLEATRTDLKARMTSASSASPPASTSTKKASSGGAKRE